MESNLSQTIDIIRNQEKYDASVKEVLADKQVLARILKYSLEEFANEDIDTIMNSMETPVVSKIRMEPGQTNVSKIEKTSEEDSIPGEGKIYYDIRFSVYQGENQIKVLINIEAQKSTNEKKLGYQLDNRIIYYLSRMISSQKEVEFTKSNYNAIKHVRSIWICMDSEDDEDSINRISLTQENVFGKEIELKNLDKVVGVIIRLRKNENAKESRNILIAMLEELLRKDIIERKKQKLREQYGMIMNDETGRRLGVMCNLSEVILEKGIEQGITQGIEQGITQGIEQGIAQGHMDVLERMIKAGFSDEQIKLCGYTDEEIAKAKENKVRP